MENKNNSAGLLKELEEKRGGKIGRRTFALWTALPSGKIFEHGMFVYEIDGTIYYEDFEKQTMNIFGFTIQKKSKEEFVKTEGSFNKDDVEKTVKVKRSKAINYAKNGTKAPASLKKASALARFFSPTVEAVILKNGEVYFFELLNNIFI